MIPTRQTQPLRRGARQPSQALFAALAGRSAASPGAALMQASRGGTAQSRTPAGPLVPRTRPFFPQEWPENFTAQPNRLPSVGGMAPVDEERYELLGPNQGRIPADIGVSG